MRVRFTRGNSKSSPAYRRNKAKEGVGASVTAHEFLARSRASGSIKSGYKGRKPAFNFLQEVCLQEKKKKIA
jgi:hypothetical protein